MGLPTVNCLIKSLKFNWRIGLHSLSLTWGMEELTDHNKVSKNSLPPHSFFIPFYIPYLGEGVKSSLNYFCHLLLKSWFNSTCSVIWFLRHCVFAFAYKDIFIHADFCTEPSLHQRHQPGLCSHHSIQSIYSCTWHLTGIHYNICTMNECMNTSFLLIHKNILR